MHIMIPNTFGSCLLVCCNLKIGCIPYPSFVPLWTSPMPQKLTRKQLTSSFCAIALVLPFHASCATTSCSLVVFFWGVTFGYFVFSSSFVDSIYKAYILVPSNTPIAHSKHTPFLLVIIVQSFLVPPWCIGRSTWWSKIFTHVLVLLEEWLHHEWCSQHWGIILAWLWILVQENLSMVYNKMKEVCLNRGMIAAIVVYFWAY